MALGVKIESYIKEFGLNFDFYGIFVCFKHYWWPWKEFMKNKAWSECHFESVF